MSIGFKSGHSLSEAEVRAIEGALGVELPPDYREFVVLQDGAEPDTNIFSVGNGNDSGVNRFIPLRETHSERRYIDDVSVEFLPVAWAEGGNYVCLDLRRGGVFFWDHEEPSGDLKLAEGFSQFLEMLAPFDVKNVELNPGQVRKVWIDPDFLKGLE
jgi:cell wall assembly regulator SMI1